VLLRWCVLTPARVLCCLTGMSVTEPALTLAGNFTAVAGTGLGGLAGWAVEVITEWGPLGTAGADRTLTSLPFSSAPSTQRDRTS